MEGIVVLTSKQITDANIVPNGNINARRDTTYDTTIEEIIVCGQVVDSASHVLKSRGVVWVVSKEEFNVPSNVTGLASLKTSWAHDGIFALNVGVIDPGWKGPVATALVNFGRYPVTISKGQPFIRVMFLEGDAVPSPRPPVYVDRKHYLSRIVDKSRAFSDTFLNMAELTDEVGREILKMPQWAYWLTITAVAVSFAAIFAPIAHSVYSDNASDKATILDFERRLDALEEEVKEAAKPKTPPTFPIPAIPQQPQSTPKP